jgi:hypothetical protein
MHCYVLLAVASGGTRRAATWPPKPRSLMRDLAVLVAEEISKAARKVYPVHEGGLPSLDGHRLPALCRRRLVA